MARLYEISIEDADLGECTYCVNAVHVNLARAWAVREHQRSESYGYHEVYSADEVGPPDDECPTARAADFPRTWAAIKALKKEAA